MGAPLFAFRNFVDLSGTSLSGGSWSSAYPQANIQDRRLAKKARTADATLTSTTMTIDLGAARYVRVAGLYGHNLSLAATVQVRGYTGSPPTGEVYDSGAVTIHDDLFPSGVLQEGHASYSSLDLETEMWGEGYPVDHTIVFTATSARYWKIDIADASNADGYVEMGRVWLSYGYKADHGISVGGRLGWESESVRTVTDGGAAIYDERTRRRTYDFTIKALEDDEALVYALEVERYLGTTGQMLLVGDVDDTAHMHRRAFLGTLERPNPVAFARSLYADKTYSVVEEL